MGFKKNWYLFILFGILLVSLFMRFYRLSDFPNGFHIDEASLGYNAYSILHTGRDDNGHFLPLYIDMFGDNRPSGYHFITIIPVLFMGLTVFATRFPAAFFGSILVLIFYFLTMVLFNNRRVALVSAAFGAIAPWSVTLSRASGEAVVALFLIMLGFALIFKSIKTEKVSFLAWGTLFVIGSFFFYHTPRVFVPSFYMTLVLYVLYFRKDFKKKFVTMFVGGFLVTCFAAFALVFLVSGGTGRFSQVNIFGFPETKLVSAEQIREDGIMNAGIMSSRIFHNKPFAYFLKATDNYLEYFTGSFLFMKGGLPHWYIVPQMGMLYLLELPFILFGLFHLITSRDKLSKMLIVWMLLAPITAAFTVDDIPNVNRVIVLFPILDIIAALGLITFIEKFKPKLRYGVGFAITVLFIFNFGYFLHQYFIHAPIHQNWYRYEGFNTVMDKVRDNYDKYDHIIVTKDSGGTYPLILFYTKYDPATYQKEGSTKDAAYTGFGKFYFAPQACPSVNQDSRFPKGKTLYIEDGTCSDNKGTHQEYIKRLDGSAAYFLLYD